MPEHVMLLLALAMCWLLLCLFVVLAASESTNYEPTLNPKKTYDYKYEGVVTVGRDIQDLAESGVKLQCSFKITTVSLQTFLLQISSVTFEEFNGIPGENSFKVSPNLTKRLAAELTKPFTFDYAKGQVMGIKSAPEVSNTVVNIVRGILSSLHVTIKTTQHIYELNELGIHGVCHSAYVIEENVEAKELQVTKSVDINNCNPKTEVYNGMALAEESKISKERGQNVVGTMTYAYTLKSTEKGALITKASAHERHYFSPFNVKSGNSKLNAMWNVTLIKENDISGKPVTGLVKSQGNLMYKVENGLGPMPILMINLSNPVPKISELIRRLSQANINQVNFDTSAEVLNLIQLLRATTYEDLELLWKQLSTNDEHRRWLLDTVVEVTDERVLKFLKSRIKTGDISASEAGQAVLVGFNHLSAKPELVEMAKEFLTIPFSRANRFLWNVVVLSYGSLVYRVCADVNPCPVISVQPLLDMAVNSQTKGQDEDMVLALKALGNAGHPLSLKTIMKFLPGFSVKADSLSIRVQKEAVQALRHLAVKDPHNVQDIALNIFAQRNVQSEIRQLASVILLETKPSIALISALTELLLHESDLHVASFTYSQLKAISQSRTPDNHYLSTNCNIAVKILARKFGRLSYRFSRTLRLDWFNDELLSGASGEIFFLRNGSSAIPTEIISKGKFYFIGRMLQLFEVGVHSEGLRELFQVRPGISEDFGVTDFAAIMKILSDWQSLPKDMPLLSVYTRIFGQEVSFVDLNQDVVQQIIKSMTFTTSKENKVWNMIQQLEHGLSWNWTKPYLIFETRYVQPTCLGLPVEISKYYSSLGAVTINAKTTISPPLKEKLWELTNTDISLKTDGFIGVAMDYFVFHGINTDLFQSGVQLSGKTVLSLPWEVEFKKNVKEKKYEFILPPCKKDTEFLKIKSDAYAVSRNIEDPLLEKMTPMIQEFSDASQSIMDKKYKVDSSVYQQKRSEMYHPKVKYCAETSVFGTAICTELEAKRVQNSKENPLNYFMGYTHFACQVEPVKPSKSVEQIKIEIEAGPHKGSTQKRKKTASQGKYKTVETTPDPVLTVKVLSLGDNAKPLGYEGTAYYTPVAENDDMQLIISEIAEEANWKICVDANIDKIQKGAKGHFKWGAECQSYEVAVKLNNSDRSGSNPTVTAEVNWREVPAYIQTIGKSIREYLPGVSYSWGFNQKHERNTEQEASATLQASTQEGFDLKIKVPELTVYRHGITIPFGILEIENAEETD